MIKQHLKLGVLMLAFTSVPLFAESPKVQVDLLGEVSAAKVLALESFSAQYENTSISQSEIDLFSAVGEKITLRVLFGTWCHDSVREVPQLIKLVETAANPNVLLQLTAVSSDKLQPEAAVARYALKFTPTIVVLKNNKEVGRIIEKPETNWAQDIVALVQLH